MFLLYPLPALWRARTAITTTRRLTRDTSERVSVAGRACFQSPADSPSSCAEQHGVGEASSSTRATTQASSLQHDGTGITCLVYTTVVRPRDQEEGTHNGSVSDMFWGGHLKKAKPIDNLHPETNGRKCTVAPCDDVYMYEIVKNTHTHT